MKNFEGRVAVVTGATRGIGRGIAEHCISEGMKVVLVGRDQVALRDFQDEVRSRGGQALAVPADVSKFDQVASLAQKTLEEFGGVHLLVNNAGLAGLEDILQPAWEVSLSEWEQTVSVNLMGVVHGIHAFTPIMLEQGDTCHIVNVSSVSGLQTEPFAAAYHTTKHGVVVLSEALYKGLGKRGANIGVTVVCPGSVSTDIVGRSADRWAAASGKSLDDWNEERRVWLRDFDRHVKEKGMAPADFAARLFEAIRAGRFYLLTHPWIKDHVKQRMEDILEERNPTVESSR